MVQWCHSQTCVSIYLDTSSTDPKEDHRPKLIINFGAYDQLDSGEHLFDQHTGKALEPAESVERLAQGHLIINTYHYPTHVRFMECARGDNLGHHRVADLLGKAQGLFQRSRPREPGDIHSGQGKQALGLGFQDPPELS